MSTAVAVIGAGVSGLACARRLLEGGVHDISVFEASNHIGGRVQSVQVAETPCDVGASYFTARSESFKQLVCLMEAEKRAARWEGRVGALNNGRVELADDPPERFCGFPSQDSLPTFLSKPIAQSINLNTRVAEMRKDNSGWTLFDCSKNAIASGKNYATVVVAAPPAHVVELCPKNVAFVNTAKSVVMQPSWVATVSVIDGMSDFDGAFINQGNLSWIAKETSKPGRMAASNSIWTLYSTSRWAAENVGLDSSDVQAKLVEELVKDLSLNAETVLPLSAIFWPFAIPNEPLKEHFLWDGRLCLGACGDWCGGPRVEGAFLSGRAMAEAVLASFSSN